MIETTYLAQQVTTTGLRDWLVDNVIVILLLLVVLAGIVASLKGQAGKVMTITALIIAPLAVLGITLTPDGPASIGRFVIGLFGLGG